MGTRGGNSAGLGDRPAVELNVTIVNALVGRLVGYVFCFAVLERAHGGYMREESFVVGGALVLRLHLSRRFGVGVGGLSTRGLDQKVT